MSDARIATARLYGFIDTAYLGDRDPAELTRQMIDGGVDVIQVRAKDAGREDLLNLGKSVLGEAFRSNVPVIINDDISVAEELSADGVHLGQEDWARLSPAERRKLSGKLRIFGMSTHSLAQALAAENAGVTYIAIGPVFKTPTKPGVTPVGVDLLREVAARVKMPVFAIGGINVETLPEVLAAGAKRVAVVSAILSAVDVCGAARRLKEHIT
jgi:thiamine-phosphate pyrophosphorylase